MSLLDLKEEETSCDEWLLAEDYLRNDVNDADQKINSALKALWHMQTKACSSVSRAEQLDTSSFGLGPWARGIIGIGQDPEYISKVSEDIEKQIKVISFLKSIPDYRQIQANKPIVINIKKEIISEFEGRIEGINGDNINIMLVDKGSNDSFVAQCKKEQFLKEGIQNIYEGLKFTCEVIKTDGAISIKLKPFNRRRLSPEEIQKIKDDINCRVED